MVRAAGGWETVGPSQGQADTGGQRRGAWESSKYQSERILLFIKLDPGQYRLYKLYVHRGTFERKLSEYIKKRLKIKKEQAKYLF